MNRFPNSADFNGVFRHKKFKINHHNDSNREAENKLINTKERYYEKLENYLSYYQLLKRFLSKYIRPVTFNPNKY